MTRSVEITTPIPTLEEVGRSLGLSKSRQNTLISLFRDSNTGLHIQNGRTGSVIERSRSRASKGVAKKAAKKAA